MLGDNPRACIFLSIHANAYVAPDRPLEFNSARGWEVYTSRGETQSDCVAAEFSRAMKKAFPEAHFREDLSDGYPDKERDFFVLRKTDMPALLTENFFMTNRQEVKLLLSENGRAKIVRAHFEAVVAVE